MKRNKNIVLFAMLLTAILTVSLMSCGKSSSEKETARTGNATEKSEVETIRLMMSNSQKIGVSAAVEAFNKEYEGKIYCDVDYVAFNDVFETLEVLMSNKSTEYDIFAADGPNVAAYVHRGYLQPLNPWFSQDEISMFSGNMITEGTYKGKLYGAAMGNSSTVMYYNKALLKEAGIDIDFDSITPTNRLTWEQLVDYSKKALAVLDPKGDKGIFGIEFQQVGRVYQMNILPNSMGGAQISDDGFSVKGILDSEPWLKALKFYQDNVQNGVFTRGISATDTSSYFQAGKILFYIGTTAMPATFEKNGFTDYGYTYIPCFEGYEDSVASACGSWTIGMNVNSNKQDAAAEFIKYLTLYKGADVYIDASGMVPALNRQFTSELLDAKPYLKLAQYEVENTAVVRAITPAFNEYSTAVNALWENVRNGADIKTAVQDCIDELTTVFKEYQ